MWWVLGIAGVLYLATRKRPETPLATEIQIGIELICDRLINAANDYEMISQAANNSGDSWEQSVQQLFHMQRIPSAVYRRPLWTTPQELPVLYRALDTISTSVIGHGQVPTLVEQAVTKPITSQGEAMHLISVLASWSASVIESRYTLPSTASYLDAGRSLAMSPLNDATRSENYGR
jgi:hypothetical protein